jgi:hypothetical protein
MRTLSDNASSVSGLSAAAASLAAILCKTTSANRSIARSSLECGPAGGNTSIVRFDLIVFTSAGMKLVVCAHEFGRGYMQISLCRHNRRMPEQFRDINEVGASMQEVGSEAVEVGEV